MLNNTEVNELARRFEETKRCLREREQEVSDLRRQLEEAKALEEHLRTRLEDAKAKLGNPRSPVVDQELAAVRADITRTAAVAAALKPEWDPGVRCGPMFGYPDEYRQWSAKLRDLLARERELMAKKEG